MATIAIAFFATTKPKAKMTMHYRCLLPPKHKEEGDDNKLPLPSLLQEHHIRK